MSLSSLVNLSSLIDDAKCYEVVRQHRWPEGVRCPHCDSASVARHGHDDTQRHWQRYRCRQCQSRFDDLTGTVLAGRGVRVAGEQKVRLSGNRCTENLSHVVSV